MTGFYGILAALLAAAVSAQPQPSPLSFEVASVKPASPGTARSDYGAGYEAGRRAALAAQGMRIKGRRVEITDNTLRDLIRLAYRLKNYQISAPNWLAEEKYEIAATMPEGAGPGQAPEMLRTLLEQRFHLKTHRETLTLAVSVLTVAKGGPKLKPAASTRAPFGDASPGRVFALSAPIALFADLLSRAERSPVVDATGIEGVYDFQLTYAAGPAATDSVPTLATALREQLGLTLQRRKMPVEILVVDGADKVPAAN